MEIPQNVQEKLKCSECDELLSCGPVYLLHETGRSICGRCNQQSQESNPKNNSRTRNESYEAAASLLGFPCAFAARGCPEKLQFSLGHPAHELSCKFRAFFCPVESRNSCEWIGSWSNLKQHFQEKHPLNIFENPCRLPRPVLTSSNLQTYVISAFTFLFLLHVKVCKISGKLFHSLRMFEDSKLLDAFSYSLEVEGSDSKFVKRGSVLRPGIMVLEEPTSNFVLINNLLGFLDGKYDESKFTIRIQTSIRSCINCFKNILDVSESGFCCECLGKLLNCKFNGKGCEFVDIDKFKCLKHEKYFCKYQKKCCWCEMNFVDCSFMDHLSSSKSCLKATKANINSIVRVPKTSCFFDYILFSSDNFGTIICSYHLSHSHFEIYLYTSLLSHELKKFKCSVELTDPQTSHTLMLTPQINYVMCDWSIYEKMDFFPSCQSVGIDLKINIEKIYKFILFSPQHL